MDPLVVVAPYLSSWRLIGWLLDSTVGKTKKRSSHQQVSLLKALKSFQAAFRMMKQSFWCPLNPLEWAGSLFGPVRSGYWQIASTCYCRAFFPFIFIFFEVNLSSFMWFLASPGEAQADSYLVLLGPPFSPRWSDVEGNFWRCSPTGEQGFEPALWALLCLVNLRASVDGGEPGQHTLHLFLYSISGFWPFYFQPQDRRHL